MPSQPASLDRRTHARTGARVHTPDPCFYLSYVSEEYLDGMVSINVDDLLGIASFALWGLRNGTRASSRCASLEHNEGLGESPHDAGAGPARPQR